MEQDVIIVGGGPAGLSLALALSGSGLRITVVERQPAAALVAPAYDGREIALTHRSIAILRDLDAWERLPAEEIFPLRRAQVLNGGSRAALPFRPIAGGHEALGSLVSNHLIRAALFEAVETRRDVTLVDQATVEGVEAGGGGAAIAMTDGRKIAGRLVVAADSRFSKLREALGIRAEMNRIGRSMLVCRVSLERDHGGTATEWFDHHQTLALLPLGPKLASAVLTVEQGEADRLVTLDDASYDRELTDRYRGRWGKMTVTSSRHAYPLVTTYAQDFVLPGAALVGDAAVGMHPVTAHGFNLGLAGAAQLARRIRLALRRGRDWAGMDVLRAYERSHRLACRPLYEGTNHLVRMFTDERLLARAARMATISIGRRLPLLRAAVQRAVLQA